MPLIATEIPSHPPRAPEIKTEQQSNRLQDDETPKADQSHSTEPVPHSQSIISASASDKSGTEAVNREEQGTEFWPPLFGYRLKVTDTLLALFTAGFFLVTLFLWLATRNLVRGADDTSQRQLRAYVGVQQIELRCVGFGIPDYQPAPRTIGYQHKDLLLVTLKNYGLTPAYDVRLWVNWYTMPYGERLPADFAYPDYGGIDPGVPQPTLTQVILHKDQEHVAIIAIFDLRPFIATRQEKSSMYIYGHITYRDIYQRRWRATFCQNWEPWSSAGVEFVPYKEHNDETELRKKMPARPPQRKQNS
jgi:hypothetical protein